MMKFYYSLAPNPMKVALCLEEMGIPYEAIPVDTRKGDQFRPEFAELNPNCKVPVIVENDVEVFDSSAILLYLAGKTGQFMPPAHDADRAALLSWMMFIGTGVGPYSGQCVHMRHFAPEPKEYAVKRYLFEAKRHYAIVEARLAKHEWMLGREYTVVDMALWGWARMVPFVLGNSPKDESVWAELPHLKRFLTAVSARPAAVRAEALKERHSFKAEFDDEARAHMFRHTVAA